MQKKKKMTLSAAYNLNLSEFSKEEKGKICIPQTSIKMTASNGQGKKIE